MADPKKNPAPTAPASDADAALAALAEVEQLKLRVQELEGELAHERAENKGLRGELDRAQKLLREADATRQKALAAQPTAAPAATPAPDAPKRYRAKGNHQLVHNGKRVKILHGEMIPDDLDVTTLRPGSYEEV